jgi:thiamine biosynthesis lipoprotein
MNPDRRDFLALGIGALAVATLPAALRRGPALVRRRVPVMGTIAEVAVRHRHEGWAQRAIDAALGELRRVERSMSRFSAESDVGRVNSATVATPVPVGEDTAAVLEEAMQWAAATDGRFDPCLGRATELWDAATRKEPPGPDETLRFADRALWKALAIERAGTVPIVRLERPDAALDLGGIAKGFAVDMAVVALRSHGVLHGLVNVGGDLVALGVDREEEPWRIGVRSPRDEDSIVEVLRVSDAAIATSGDYVHYFQHGGRRYHHLLDPATGAPRRTRTRSLTVEAERCMTADAAATALFGASSSDRAHLLQRAAIPARIVHEIQEVEA